MDTVVTTKTQPLTVRRVLSFPFKVLGKILRVIFWAVLIVAIITAGVAGVWLMGKVETASGPAPRWKIGQAWIEHIAELQGICKTGTVTALLYLPIATVGEPVSAVIKGDIKLLEIPARAKGILEEAWKMFQEPLASCPPMLPAPATLEIE